MATPQVHSRWQLLSVKHIAEVSPMTFTFNEFLSFYELLFYFSINNLKLYFVL